jgi:hypothetical protein
MLKDIVEVKVVGDHSLWLRFEDGVEGNLDVAKLIAFKGVFAPLKDSTVFAKVELDRELGTIRWPNGADLDPDVLYAVIAGREAPDLSREPASSARG